VTWPDRPATKEDAFQYVRRYDCLALMMSKQQKIEDEHRFFRLSMQAKEVRDGWWSLGSIASRVYGALFDYGWGFERALGLWFLNIMFPLFYFGMALGIQSNGPGIWGTIKASISLGFSNAHSFFGLHRGAAKLAYEAAEAIPGFNMIWGLQGIAGTILLFFLLLTIRNRFRLR
jgi:hypothetical protein